MAGQVRVIHSAGVGRGRWYASLYQLMSLVYWEDQDFADVEKARTYGELFSVAARILIRLQPPAAQVCGPISTGGAGSIPANLERFSAAIKKLQGEGHEIFDQMPFEDSMHRIWRERDTEGYDHGILEDFYLPIFESGYLHRLFFLPDWETSTGARWEHAQGLRLGMEIIYIEA